MKQNNLIQSLLLTFIIVVTASLAIPAHIPTTGADNVTETTTVKTYVDNSTVTWYEISIITTTYTNTSTIVQTNTSYKIVLKPTTVILVVTREVTDARGRVSIIQEYVPKVIMETVTDTLEILTTLIIEFEDYAIITSSKAVTETRYSTRILVETFSLSAVSMTPQLKVGPLQLEGNEIWGFIAIVAITGFFLGVLTILLYQWIRRARARKMADSIPPGI